MKNVCDWGRKAWSAEDPRECGTPAVGVVPVRDEGGVIRMDLCQVHRVLLLAETAPVGS